MMQHQLLVYAKTGQIGKYSELIKQGGEMRGIHLGLAALGNRDLMVNWLLEKDCPVDNDTWLFVAGSKCSVWMTQIISQPRRRNGVPDLTLAGIYAAMNLDQAMLEYVVLQTGWKKEYLDAICDEDGYELGTHTPDYYEFMKWVDRNNKK
jgi:hypothetical protein